MGNRENRAEEKYVKDTYSDKIALPTVVQYARDIEVGDNILLQGHWFTVNQIDRYEEKYMVMIYLCYGQAKIKGQLFGEYESICRKERY